MLIIYNYKIGVNENEKKNGLKLNSFLLPVNSLILDTAFLIGKLNAT